MGRSKRTRRVDDKMVSSNSSLHRNLNGLSAAQTSDSSSVGLARSTGNEQKRRFVESSGERPGNTSRGSKEPRVETEATDGSTNIANESLPMIGAVDSDIESCPICLDRVKDETHLDGCQHRFCYECASEWVKLNPHCPVCKRPVLVLRHNFRPVNGPTSQLGYDEMTSKELRNRSIQEHIRSESDAHPMNAERTSLISRIRQLRSFARDRETYIRRYAHWNQRKVCLNNVRQEFLGKANRYQLLLDNFDRPRSVIVADPTFRLLVYEMQLVRRPIVRIEESEEHPRTVTPQLFMMQRDEQFPRISGFIRRELACISEVPQDCLDAVVERVYRLMCLYQINEPRFAEMLLREPLLRDVRHAYLDHFAELLFEFASSFQDLVTFDGNSEYISQENMRRRQRIIGNFVGGPSQDDIQVQYEGINPGTMHRLGPRYDRPMNLRDALYGLQPVHNPFLPLYPQLFLPRANFGTYSDRQRRSQPGSLPINASTQSEPSLLSLVSRDNNPDEVLIMSSDSDEDILCASPQPGPSWATSTNGCGRERQRRDSDVVEVAADRNNSAAATVRIDGARQSFVNQQRNQSNSTTGDQSLPPQTSASSVQSCLQNSQNTAMYAADSGFQIPAGGMTAETLLNFINGQGRADSAPTHENEGTSGHSQRAQQGMSALRERTISEQSDLFRRVFGASQTCHADSPLDEERSGLDSDAPADASGSSDEDIYVHQACLLPPFVPTASSEPYPVQPASINSSGGNAPETYPLEMRLTSIGTIPVSHSSSAAHSALGPENVVDANESADVRASNDGDDDNEEVVIVNELPPKSERSWPVITLDDSIEEEDAEDSSNSSAINRENPHLVGTESSNDGPVTQHLHEYAATELRLISVSTQTERSTKKADTRAAYSVASPLLSADNKSRESEHRFSSSSVEDQRTGRCRKKSRRHHHHKKTVKQKRGEREYKETKEAEVQSTLSPPNWITALKASLVLANSELNRIDSNRRDGALREEDSGEVKEVTTLMAKVSQRLFEVNAAAGSGTGEIGADRAVDVNIRSGNMLAVSRRNDGSRSSSFTSDSSSDERKVRSIIVVPKRGREDDIRYSRRTVGQGSVKVEREESYR